MDYITKYPSPILSIAVSQRGGHLIAGLSDGTWSLRIRNLRKVAAEQEGLYTLVICCCEQICRSNLEIIFLKDSPPSFPIEIFIIFHYKENLASAVSSALQILGKRSDIIFKKDVQTGFTYED